MADRKPLSPLDRALWCAMTDWVFLLVVAVLVVLAWHPAVIVLHDTGLGG